MTIAICVILLYALILLLTRMWTREAKLLFVGCESVKIKWTQSNHKQQTPLHARASTYKGIGGNTRGITRTEGFERSKQSD